MTAEFDLSFLNLLLNSPCLLKICVSVVRIDKIRESCLLYPSSGLGIMSTGIFLVFDLSL